MIQEALKYLIGLGQVENLRGKDPVYPSDVVAVPEGVKVSSLEQFQVRPNRIKHVATLVASAAFVDYVNRFKTPQTSIYLDIFGDHPSFAAIIDHHGPSTPEWGGHRANYTPRLSLEWVAWTQLHAKGPIDQAELVAFMEDHANDLSSPSPSAMLTALSKFEAVEKHTYKQAVNLDNGNISLTYVKDGGTVKVEFPHTFDLWIPVLENEPAIDVEGRIRYRTKDGTVTFTVQLKQDPERIQRDAVRKLAQDVRAGCPDVKHYEGVARG